MNNNIFSKMSDAELKICNIALQTLIYVSYTDSSVGLTIDENTIENMQLELAKEQYSRKSIAKEVIKNDS